MSTTAEQVELLENQTESADEMITKINKQITDLQNAISGESTRIQSYEAEIVNCNNKIQMLNENNELREDIINELQGTSSKQSSKKTNLKKKEK